MEITFYGVRGSIPAPGSETFRYGGNTVCVQVTLADGTIVILDAGSGMRPCGRALLQKQYKMPINILHTHAHWDHLMGVPFFAPLYQRETWVRTWPMATPGQREAQRKRIMFDSNHFPVRADDLPARFENMDDDSPVWRIGSAAVRRIALNHPGGAQGFRIDDEDGRSLAFLTDNELSPPGPVQTSMDELARFSASVDVLIHDSQYVAADLPAKHGWGHSIVPDVLKLAKMAETRHVALFHHDPERSDDALDAIGATVRRWIDTHAPHITATMAYEGLILRPSAP